MGWGFATCHMDDEPLVATFEFPGYEFICVVCRTKYGYLQPKPEKNTDALAARLVELKAQYAAERASLAGEEATADRSDTTGSSPPPR